MSTRPSRMDTAGRVFLDLRRKARAEARATSELLQLYALEGFLDRLAHSKHADRLVLKGGALLAAYDLRRATRDLDFQAKRVANDPSIILSLVREIASVERADGLAFDPHTATSEAIREGDAYQGVRVKLPCTLASARVGSCPHGTFQSCPPMRSGTSSHTCPAELSLDICWSNAEESLANAYDIQTGPTVLK